MDDELRRKLDEILYDQLEMRQRIEAIEDDVKKICRDIRGIFEAIEQLQFRRRYNLSDDD